jgi:hypothetical protein
MIEHTMAVTEAELGAAIEACSRHILEHTVADLLSLKQGWFTYEAVGKARSITKASAKNFSAQQAENGTWERKPARGPTGKLVYLYRVAQKPKKGGRR